MAKLVLTIQKITAYKTPAYIVYIHYKNIHFNDD